MPEDIKKITAVFATPVEDAEMKRVLTESAQVPTTAAEVIRNTSGKVISVNVHLPESASDTAVAKIAANGGMATMEGDPSAPALWQWDGDQASLDALTAVYFTQSTYGGSVLTDNEDGTSTLSGSGIYYLKSANTFLQSPNEGYSELKAKFTSDTNPTNAILYARNNGLSAKLTISGSGFNSSINLNGTITPLANLVPDITAFHTYRMTLGRNSVTIAVDGEDVDTVRGQSVNTTNLDNLIIQTYSPGTVIVDHWHSSKIEA